MLHVPRPAYKVGATAEEVLAVSASEPAALKSELCAILVLLWLEVDWDVLLLLVDIVVETSAREIANVSVSSESPARATDFEVIVIWYPPEYCILVYRVASLAVTAIEGLLDDPCRSCVRDCGAP